MGCKPDHGESQAERDARVWKLRFENINQLVHSVERLTFYEGVGEVVGEFFSKKGTYDYVMAPTLEEVIVLLQEKIL